MASTAMSPSLALAAERAMLRRLASGHGGRLVLMITLLTAKALHADLNAFQQYVHRFGKAYRKGDADFDLRYLNWLRSKALIDDHQARHPNGSFYLRENHFSDLSLAEVKSRFSRDLRKSKAFAFMEDGYEDPDSHRGHIIPLASAPDTVDWRSAPGNTRSVVAVTPVKNQGLCGACWGFSTVAAIEGAVAIYTRQLNELSVQELIDCVTQNEGCSGGDFEYSFEYSVSNGLQSSSSYRFIQRPTGMCNLDTNLVASRITAYGQIAMCNTQSLLQVVATRPVAVAIDGSCDSFIHYGGGIYTESCGNHLNHAVTIVGYGTDGTTPYWIIKNSWGSQWGESGYGRIARGMGKCGLSNIEEYGFYAMGGIAYVNGTTYVNDDQMVPDRKLTLLEKILAWKYLTVMLGIAIGLLLLPIVSTIVRIIKKRYRDDHPTSRRRQHQQHLMSMDSMASSISPQELLAISMLSNHQPAFEWACPWCTFINQPNRERCEMCDHAPGRESAIVQLNDDETTGVMMRL